MLHVGNQYKPRKAKGLSIRKPLQVCSVKEKKKSQIFIKTNNLRRPKYLLHFSLGKPSLYYYTSILMVIFSTVIIYPALYSINSTPDNLEVIEDSCFSCPVFFTSVYGQDISDFLKFLNIGKMFTSLQKCLSP